MVVNTNTSITNCFSNISNHTCFTSWSRTLQ